jgi:hypothetical protein
MTTLSLCEAFCYSEGKSIVLPNALPPNFFQYQLWTTGQHEQIGFENNESKQ